jgi:hypothetical protein
MIRVMELWALAMVDNPVAAWWRSYLKEIGR